MKAFNEEILLLIEQYIRGELKGDALLGFEQKIAQDNDLKKEISLRKSLAEGISDYGHLKERIKRIDKKIKTEKNKHKWSLALAAALLFFIFGAIVYFSFSEKDSIHLEPIIAGISADAKYIPTIRANRGNTSFETEQIFGEFYDNKQYKECITIGDTLANDSLFHELSIYYGFSHESLGQYQKAIDIYGKIIKKDGKYITEALFHKAFCHMKLREKDEAIAALNSVVASREDSPFQEKAKKLLEDLSGLDEGEWKE